MDNALITLQEIVSHQAMQISQLSDELYAQQREITELRTQLNRLHQKYQQLSERQSDNADTLPEPPPPHY